MLSSHFYTLAALKLIMLLKEKTWAIQNRLNTQFSLKIKSLAVKKIPQVGRACIVV